MAEKLCKLCFEDPYAGNKHPYIIIGDLRLTISNPHHGDISTDLLKRILCRAEVTRDEWIALK